MNNKGNIVLIGFMGAGKTTVGRWISQNVNMKYIDTDDYIEAGQNMTIKDIFANYGEEFFRVNFSYAVEHGLLTDYKVLVLTVNEDDLPDNILSDIKDPNNVELNFDDTSKLIGIVMAFPKSSVVINTQHGMQIQR